MFIGLENIQSALQETESDVFINAPDYCLTSFSPIKNAIPPYSRHVLYIVKSPAELKDFQPIPDMNLFICNPEKKELSKIISKLQTPLNYLDFHAPLDDKVLFKIREYFNTSVGMGLVAESILSILFYNNGIQSMVDSFTRGFNNPVFVFDAGYHLIACNWEMANETPAGRKIVENMGFTEDEFRMVNAHNHIHEKVIRSEKPILLHNTELGYDQLLCAIDTRKNLGHIVINASRRPINEMDYHLLVMLKEGIYQQMRKEEFINDNNGFPYEYFLKDLLDGKIATPERYRSHMNYVNTTFSENMHCLVVETSKSSSTLNLFLIRNRLENLFPDTKTLMYNGEIIVLFCLPKGTPLTPQDYDRISKTCKELDIYAGISNSFSNLLELSAYYKQAIRAMEIGSPADGEPGLFIYRDYYMQHIANIFLQKESGKTYCHPAMKRLFEHDKFNDAELAETLYTYLLCERNMSAASEALYVHRNTMTYRLKKIDSMVKINYEDPGERQYLILSYELNQPLQS